MIHQITIHQYEWCKSLNLECHLPVHLLILAKVTLKFLDVWVIIYHVNLKFSSYIFYITYFDLTFVLHFRSVHLGTSGRSQIRSNQNQWPDLGKTPICGNPTKSRPFHSKANFHLFQSRGHDQSRRGHVVTTNSCVLDSWPARCFCERARGRASSRGHCQT